MSELEWDKAVLVVYDGAVLGDASYTIGPFNDPRDAVQWGLKHLLDEKAWDVVMLITPGEEN